MSRYRLSSQVEDFFSSKFTFRVEWFDPTAQISRIFLLTFYSSDKTIELFDCKKKKIFLRRCKIDDIGQENLYKGAMVNILSRQMKILDYSDEQTKRLYEDYLGNTFCLIKPDATKNVGEIITFLQEHEFRLTDLKMAALTNEGAQDFYKHLSGEACFQSLLDHITSGPCIALCVIGKKAVNRWLDYLGPEDASKAKREAPSTLRAIYGTDAIRNGVHGSCDEAHVAYETDLFFSKHTQRTLPTCVLKNTTCGIIKPHAVAEGSAGPILSYITQNGFKITALEMFTLKVPSCEELMEVYKGVIPEFAAMVTEMTSGPCIAMEVQDQNSENTHGTFRKLCGPMNPDIASKLRPDTIRAKWGRTNVKNAIHCTDLPEDAILEVEYFFKILQ